MSDETPLPWQCPAGSWRGAAEWVAEQEKPPVEEFRKNTRDLYIWTEVEEVDHTTLGDAAATALAAMGMRPHARYSTMSAFGHISGVPTAARWEWWRSDDGITTGLVLFGENEPRLMGLETRFESGEVVHLPTAPMTPTPRNEYLIMSGDPVVDYIAHRARVRERIEAGEIALSVAEQADREAYTEYFADYLSSEAISDQAARIRNLTSSAGGGNTWLWLMPVVFVLLAICVLVWLISSGGVGYWAWFVAFWPIALVASVPQALMQYAVLAFRGHMNHLDHKYPDSMDQHAGYWLKGRIAAEGLADKVEVGKAKETMLSGLDAYLPLRNKIILGARTYEKQDPTFWAIAAHELGHAVDAARRPVMMPLSLVCRVLFRQLLSWGTAVMLANTFVGWDVANTAWRWLFVGAVVCGLVVLMDEAIASIIGVRILRGDDRITDAMIVDLRRHLGLAFATYCSPIVALAVILVAADPIATYIQEMASFQPTAPLHPGRTSVGNVLSVILLIVLLALERKRFVRWLSALRSRSESSEPQEDDDRPKTLFCAKCGERYAAGADECPSDGTLLVDVGAPDEEQGAPADPKDIVPSGWGCLGILVSLTVTAAFFLEVWDQPLGPAYQAAVFVYAPLMTFVLAPVLIPVTLLLLVPSFIANRLELVPKPPKQGRVARAKDAAADVVSEITVLDPRQGTPWYLDVATPGMLLHTLPLIVLWWMSQL